ncbi:integrase core domain-containing protein [Amycolatopsis rhabdoformis]|uniref:integrase core domain-containing protein n=1 Tax=Amycolatopsis rhabdoformis TaxID=1448059 RepID=UPI0038995863
MTDHARAHRCSLREVRAEHGIRPKFIKPHCPSQNGKAEHLNRTLQTKCAYRQTFAGNTQRRHNALGDHPPTTRLPPTPWPNTARRPRPAAAREGKRPSPSPPPPANRRGGGRSRAPA